MDHSAASASVFDKLADKYREKYMDLTMYDDSYREFCALIRPGRARVLDAACGPGNVSRYLMGQRPDLDLLSLDLAPRMVELARKAVPSARLVVHDCRNLAGLIGNTRFDAIICAFGLPYLSWQEAEALIKTCADALVCPGGVLYLSTILSENSESGFQRCSTGDQVYLNYHREDQVIRSLHDSGFTIVTQKQTPSPKVAPTPTTDLIVIARK